MASDKTIRTFTALDIEKYHKGLLSPKERHGLEKASLDDPFLADALEGYAVSGVDVQADIATLKKRLAERNEGGKVVMMPDNTGKTSSFPWRRIAVMLILIAGAGLLAYQFVFNNKKNRQPDIAQSKENDNKANTTLDTGKTVGLNTDKAASSASDSINNAQLNGSAEQWQANTDYLKEKSPQAGKRSARADSTFLNYKSHHLAVTPPSGYATITPVEKADDLEKKRELASTPAKPLSGEGDIKKDADAGVRDESKLAMQRQKAVENDKYYSDTSAYREGALAMNDRQRNQGLAKNAPSVNHKASNGYLKTTNNTFFGVVTDVNSNPLPFANVTNVQDNIGTYADVNGKFILTSTDSILNVQVKSNGFNNNNIQLRNGIANNQVVLQEDKSLAIQTLPKNPNAPKYPRNGNMQLEGEPEPEDGWENYDSYLSNNLNIPDEALRGKQNGGGSVEVSFEVNNEGEPVKFKVVKSLCPKCDQEAIRLIKEGPKWKQKAKKGRTTVTISF